MTKKEAIQIFKCHVIPLITIKEEETGIIDKLLRRHEWGCFINTLYSNHNITLNQHHNWIYPANLYNLK